MIGIEEIAAMILIVMGNRGVSRKKAIEIIEDMNNKNPSKDI